MMVQGYVTVALDQQKYLDMAVNLSKSLRYFDKKRPICVITNSKVSIPQDIKKYFNDIVDLPPDADFVGCMNKVRVGEVSPYEENMYIDADCLLVKNDIDRHWHRASTQYFSMTGEKCTSGKWNNLEIQQACTELSLPYIVKMNSGVFYFRQSPETTEFFECVISLYKNHRDLLSNIHQGRAHQYADEPFFGAAMGKLHLSPVEGQPEEGSWMVTTWRARRCIFDPARGISSLEKPSRHFLNVPLFPYGWVEHSPTIAHFIGLKPQRIYEQACRFFSREFDVS